MQSTVMTTAQRGCVAFYYHRRDHGIIPEHQHDVHQISITIGGPLNVRWWSANRGEERFVAADGNIIVNPAHEPHRAQFEGAWESAGFYLNPSVTEAVARDLGLAAQAGVAPSCRGHDAAAYGLALSLLRETGRDPLSCRLYAESMANLLAARMLLGYLGPQPKMAGVAPALSAAAMRRVESFVTENLERNLSVSDIAEAISLSAYHFSRRFRARTGMSPYHYVMRQRVERARQLLRDPELSLAEIAYRSGFSSQSHLCVQFRRMMGATPGRYREAL